jgi:Tfp pilus assembly protein PilF
MAALGAALLLAACGSAPASDEEPLPPRSTDPVRALVAEGDRAERDGDLDAALAAWAKAAAARPAHPLPHLRRASALVRWGRGAEARALYAARATAPDATPAEKAVAARLAADATPASVRAAYVAAANAEPGNAWWRLALAEVDLAMADAAVRAAAKARDDGDPDAVAKGDADAEAALVRARAAVTHAAQRDPSLPEVDFFLGLLATLEGERWGTPASRKEAAAEAAKAYRRAVARDPTMVDAWANLGDALLAAGKDCDALEPWVTAARLAPRDGAIRAGVARALEAERRPAEAAAQWAEAARGLPRDAAPRLAEGRAWLEAGDPSKAVVAFRDALRREPAAVEPYLRLGIAFEKMGREEDAREAYATYLRRGGAHAADAQRGMKRLGGASAAE